MPSSGRLIALEGGEGAGKSTQASFLATALGADLTREPGGTPLGEHLRQLVLEGASAIDARAELMMMLAARAQHLSERIEPALCSGRHVVVDRFMGSTLAYQGYGRGLAVEEVRSACLLAAGGRAADLNVLIDVPVALGSARRSRAGAKDRIEREDDGFHERVRQGFLSEAAADPAHWCVVDGTAPPEEVGEAVLSAVVSRLDLEWHEKDR